MKKIIVMTAICSSILLSSCTAKTTPDLNMHNLRVADISTNDGTSVIATFCAGKAFDVLFFEEPTPQRVYPILDKSKKYTGFKSETISKYYPYTDGEFFKNNNL